MKEKSPDTCEGSISTAAPGVMSVKGPTALIRADGSPVPLEIGTAKYLRVLPYFGDVHLHFGDATCQASERDMPLVRNAAEIISIPAGATHVSALGVFDPKPAPHVFLTPVGPSFVCGESEK